MVQTQMLDINILWVSAVCVSLYYRRYISNLCITILQEVHLQLVYHYITGGTSPTCVSLYYRRYISNLCTYLKVWVKKVIGSSKWVSQLVCSLRYQHTANVYSRCLTLCQCLQLSFNTLPMSTAEFQHCQCLQQSFNTLPMSTAEFQHSANVYSRVSTLCQCLQQFQHCRCLQQFQHSAKVYSRVSTLCQCLQQSFNTLPMSTAEFQHSADVYSSFNTADVYSRVSTLPMSTAEFQHSTDVHCRVSTLPMSTAEFQHSTDVYNRVSTLYHCLQQSFNTLPMSTAGLHLSASVYCRSSTVLISSTLFLDFAHSSGFLAGICILSSRQNFVRTFHLFLTRSNVTVQWFNHCLLLLFYTCCVQCRITCCLQLGIICFI